MVLLTGRKYKYEGQISQNEREQVNHSQDIHKMRTTTLGGTASDVVVGKIGVSSLPLATSQTVSHAWFTAWAYDDDVRMATANLADHVELEPSLIFLYSRLADGETLLFPMRSPSRPSLPASTHSLKVQKCC